MKICSIEGCEKPARRRGWCDMHWIRWRKHGDPNVSRSYLPSTPENFWARTKPEGECVIWTGGTGHGYGSVGWKGKTVTAHRLAFYLRMGRWPDGLLRHLCNNRLCVLHAVEGTNSENMLDAVAAGTHNHARKTHCKRGHPFDEANTYHYRGRRRCRACHTEIAPRLREEPS